jgi:ketosteroid isomerase-like protein
MSATDELREIVDKTVAALTRLTEGDAEPFNALVSNGPDATVFGAIGGYDSGSDAVKQQTRFVASRFHGSQNLHVEPLAMGLSGDLAYTVWIERGQVRVAGRDDYAPLALRVTHIFRRENGEWKIVHRHGDGVVEKSDVPPARRP